MSIARFWCRKCDKYILRAQAVRDPDTEVLVCPDCADPKNPWENFKPQTGVEPRPVKEPSPGPNDWREVTEASTPPADYKNLLS